MMEEEKIRIVSIGSKSATWFVSSQSNDGDLGSLPIRHAEPPRTMMIINSQNENCGQRVISSRTVSWSSDGQYLAMGGSDRLTHIFTEGAREVLAISGHAAAVGRVRFHPDDSNLLISIDSKDMRMWDIRGGTQRSSGVVKSTPNMFGVEWNRAQPDYMVAFDPSARSVFAYDRRKFASGPVYTDVMTPHVPDACQFSPDGKYLVAGTSANREGVGELRIWNWKEGSATDKQVSVFPAHCGPIYGLAFSRNGKRIITGGADATAGLWNTDTLTCMKSLSNGTKFISSLDFSGDNEYFATATRGDDMLLAKSSNGEVVGKISWPEGGGVEEMSWHPSKPWIACARSTNNQNPSPVVISKLSLGQ